MALSLMNKVADWCCSDLNAVIQADNDKNANPGVADNAGVDVDDDWPEFVYNSLIAW